MSAAAYNRGSRIVSRGADERMPVALSRADQQGVEDAAASENVETFVRGFGMRFRNYDTSDPTNSYCVSAKESFRTLWESIHGADGWARNPWVWVVSFRVVMP